MPFPELERLPDHRADGVVNWNACFCFEPVLASVYATLIAKVHRVRGAANADTLRWAESASENEAILAALTDKDQDDLPRILHEHAENAAREVLALLRR